MLLRLGEISKKWTNKNMPEKYQIWKYCPQMKFHVFQQIETHAKGCRARWQTHTVPYIVDERKSFLNNHSSSAVHGKRRTEAKVSLAGTKVFLRLYFLSEKMKWGNRRCRSGKKRGSKKCFLITLGHIEYQRQQFPDLYSDLCYQTTQKKPVANSSWLI